MGRIIARLYRKTIYIGDSMQIVNKYTRFSEKSWAHKIRTKVRIRELSGLIDDYHKDRFGTIRYFERTKHRGHKVDKVYFDTDSGYRTWRYKSNAEKYNELTRNINIYRWASANDDDNDELFHNAVSH